MAGVDALGRRKRPRGRSALAAVPLKFLYSERVNLGHSLRLAATWPNIWISTWRQDTNRRTAVYAARAGIEEAPLCTPISARTARSHRGQKLAVGPAMTRPVSCSTQFYSVRCDVIHDVMGTGSFIRVLYESTQFSHVLKLPPSRVPPWKASLPRLQVHSNIFRSVYDER